MSGTRAILKPTIFKPTEWQRPVLADKSPTLLLTGSAGGGKSHIAAMKIHLYCAKYPGATALILRKTRQSMKNSSVLFFERKILGPRSPVRHIPSAFRFEYQNGSILAYGGMADANQREDVRSIGQDGGLDIVWMEEANKFVEDDFQEIIPRMRGKAGPWRQKIVTTNPDSDQHWIYKRLIKGKQANVYYSHADDNPFNPEDYSASLDSLTGVMRMRLRDAIWCTAEGAIYPDFSHELHIVDSFKIPDDWRRMRSIDFGFTNPFVCQWWAQSPDDDLYLYREIYHTQRLVSDHAKMINFLSQGERIEYTVADHDAEDRATLKACGIITIPAKKDVSPGLQAVAKRLSTNNPGGKPKLFILADAIHEVDHSLEAAKRPTCTMDEFPGYVWAHGEKGPKETPVKINDHGMDTMRYLVASVDMKAAGGRTFKDLPSGF